MENNIDKSLELDLQKARELRVKEQEEYITEFITERNKVFASINDIKKVKKPLKLVKIEVESDEEIEPREVSRGPPVEPVIIEPIKLVEPVIKSVLQESREEVKNLPKYPNKLINVQKDINHSTRDGKIEELEDKIVDMQNKYNSLMKKFKNQKQELDDCKKYKDYYDKMHSNKLTVNEFIKNNYEITTNKLDRIKCSELYDEYCKLDKSISQIEFNKQVQNEGIFKSKLDGKNYFKCIKPLLI